MVEELVVSCVLKRLSDKCGCEFFPLEQDYIYIYTYQQVKREKERESVKQYIKERKNKGGC